MHPKSNPRNREFLRFSRPSIRLVSSSISQVARYATLEGMGHLNGSRYVLYDRDAKFSNGILRDLGSRVLTREGRVKAIREQR
jgi:hypothetical protein